MTSGNPINRFKTRPRRWSDGVEDQSRQSRMTRLSSGRCPIHDKPLLQSDVWYKPKNGKRYTFVSCMHPKCRIEAICSSTFDEFTLVPDWRFLLHQTDEGTAQIIQLLSKKDSKQL